MMGLIRVAYSLVFYVVSCVLLFVCLSFSFLAMALSVYFRFMSLAVPLVSVVSLSKVNDMSNSSSIFAHHTDTLLFSATPSY